MAKLFSTIIRSANHIVMPWKDGGGITREIARCPPVSSSGAPGPDATLSTTPDAETAIASGSGLAHPSFAWRVSLADIAASCTFSRFAGYDRILFLVRGDSMTLHVGRQPAIALVRYARCSFDGEAPVRCTLSEGPVQDLNVMVARGRASAVTQVLRPGRAMQWPALAGSSLLLYSCGGGAELESDHESAFDLEDGDTLRIDAGASTGERVEIALADSSSAVVIAVSLTLLHEADRALCGPAAAKAS